MGGPDWYELKRHLVHACGLRPWEVQRLTEAEVALYCDPPDPEGKPQPPAGSVPLTPGYAEWWRSLSPEEKLARAREA